jgi:hypothetical protein
MEVEKRKAGCDESDWSVVSAERIVVAGLTQKLARDCGPEWRSSK